MLFSEWYRFVSRFQTVPFPILWGPFQVHQIQLVSPSPHVSQFFLVLWQGPSSRLIMIIILLQEGL